MVILVIDDEPLVLRVIASILTRSGHEVFRASTVHEAITACAQIGHAVELIVSDVSMPGLYYGEFSDWLNQQNAILPIILISGFPADHPTVLHIIDSHLFDRWSFLPKPFSSTQLMAALDEVSQGVSDSHIQARGDDTAGASC